MRYNCSLLHPLKRHNFLTILIFNQQQRPIKTIRLDVPGVIPCVTIVKLNFLLNRFKSSLLC